MSDVSPSAQTEQVSNFADGVAADVAEWQNNSKHRAAREVDAALAEAEGEIVGEQPSGEVVKTEATAEASAAELSFAEEKARVAKALREREKAHQERTHISRETQRQMAELQQMQAQMRAEYQELQRQKQWLNDLRQNPMQAIQQAGYEPEDFLFSLAKDGTPEGRQARELQEMKQRLAAAEEYRQRQERAAQEYQQRQQEAQLRQYRESMVNNFVSLASSDKYGSVSKALSSGLVTQSALVSMGDDIADRYREATRGQEASAEDICEYLNEQFTQALSKFSPAPAPQVPKAPPVQRQKPLSNADASERRAYEAPSAEDGAEERKARALRAVRAVMAKNKQEEA